MAKETRPVNWRAWLIAILIILVIVICLQNSQTISVEVLFASFNAPLIIVLLVAVLIGVVIGYVGPLVLRHRRATRAAQIEPPAGRSGHG